jgi:hypothetical protein
MPFLHAAIYLKIFKYFLDNWKGYLLLPRCSNKANYNFLPDVYDPYNCKSILVAFTMAKREQR